MKLKSLHLLLAVSLILLSYACIKKNIKNPKPLEEVTISKNLAYQLVDPQLANVSVSAANLEANIFKDQYKIPSFSLNFNGNDYVQIIRCLEDYRELLKMMLEQGQKHGASERKWAWLDSIGNPKFCKVASLRFNGDQFQDLGAQNAKIFYVINPCVSSLISKTGKDECSYQLALTNSLDYKNSPAEIFIKKSNELLQAESQYDETVSQIIGLSKKLMNLKNQCEYDIDLNYSQKNSESFGWDVLSAAIAIGGAFAARSLISRRSINGISQYASKYKQLRKLLPGLNAIKSSSSLNKNLFTAGIFSSALAISQLIRKAKANHGANFNSQACTQADKIAQEITSIEDQEILQKSMQRLIEISKELAEIESHFVGYQDASFTMQEG